jgi:MerR family transcriptional regulator, copper efflux regulator
MNGLTIGELAEQANVHVETLRYYEGRGLIDRPARSASNYRLYPADAARRARFSKRAQALGFSLKDIKGLLSLRAVPETECGEVRRHAEAKIIDISEKIQALTAMKRVLSKLVTECSGERPLAECPILESLENKETTPCMTQERSRFSAPDAPPVKRPSRS